MNHRGNWRANMQEFAEQTLMIDPQQKPGKAAGSPPKADKRQSSGKAPIKSKTAHVSGGHPKDAPEYLLASESDI